MSAERVLAGIDRDELVALAVEMGNIYSPSGEETAIADFVFAWLARHGFRPRREACLAGRSNVIATERGSGGGYGLLFNSHMDTAIAKDESAGFLLPMPEVLHKAWEADGQVYGHAIINDRGPMAAWMIAAKAIKQAGVTLKGDLVLVGAVSETTGDPVDEFTSPFYQGKEAGTKYTIVRGAVADFALVAEATAFSPVWVEAGEAYYKIRIHGGYPLYTPYVPRFKDAATHPNAIVRAAKFVEALAEWANRFEDAYRYECAGGIVEPKINIGAIRGGVPYKVVRTQQMCDLYVDVRIPPDADPLTIRAELERVMRDAGLAGVVELYTYRRGYEGKDVGPLVGAVTGAHRRVLGHDPKPAAPSFSSMWRDLNAYNEVGIPSITYGPATGTGGGNSAISVEDLVNASRIYALTALDLCNREKPMSMRT